MGALVGLSAHCIGWLVSPLVGLNDSGYRGHDSWAYAMLFAHLSHCLLSLEDRWPVGLVLFFFVLFCSFLFCFVLFSAIFLVFSIHFRFRLFSLFSARSGSDLSVL